MSVTESENERALSAIHALNAQWEQGFEQHDAAAMVALFTEDCMRMPQGGPATVGRSALAAAYQRDFAEVWGAGATVQLNTQEVIIAGEYAFARGADRLIQADKPQGQPGKWIFIYRRQPDGDWKFHWVTFNRSE